MSLVTELEARGAFSAALAALEEHGGSPYRDQYRELGDAVAHQHGRLLWRRARFDRAEHVLAAALAHRRATVGDDHLDTLDTAERLAAVAHFRGDSGEGAARFRAVIATLDRVVGPDHLRAGIARRNLAACLRDGGGPGAVSTLDEAARVIVARAGRGSPDHVAVLKGRAVCPSCRGRRMADAAAHLVDRVLPRAPTGSGPCQCRGGCALCSRATGGSCRQH